MTRIITSSEDVSKAWWKSATVYQIYPASFCDSNGDGIGDLPGVISKLDYLKHLGVDVVWLCPIFKSPQIDMGYDISDYREVHAPYGTVSDVKTLIAELHKRGMKLLLDLVVNHTSDLHEWFVESRSSRTAEKRDWYIWRPAKYDQEGNRLPPNNWKASLGGGSVWEWDEETQEYYLHYYDAKMPDLNFDNPDVRQAVYELMRFWLDKGCDGFRMDVIGRISKDHTFPDTPIIEKKSKWQPVPRHLEGPRIHEFLQEMNREVMSNYDVMSVGELNETTPEQMLRYVHPKRHEIQMGFCFDHVNLGLGGGDKAIVGDWTIPEFTKIIAKWQGLREEGGWHALYLENHDQPRCISRYANDSPKWRIASAKMLALMHATLWGTLYLFQGQEIGMKNLPEDWPLEEWKDVKTQNVVRTIRAKGEDVEELTRKVYHKARDNGRSPMQWNAARQAGFSETKPWMRVNDDYKECNVTLQLDDQTSVFAFWKDILALRKQLEDSLIYGSFQHVSPEHVSIFAYLRAEKFLVILNFSEDTVQYRTPFSVKGAQRVRATVEGATGTLDDDTLEVMPYAGYLYELPSPIRL